MFGLSNVSVFISSFVLLRFLPILTDSPLLQPRQGLQTRPRRIKAKDGHVATPLYRTRGPEELHCNDDERHHPEDKEDEGADHDDGREEAAVENEVEEQDDVGEREGGDGDEERKVPAKEATRRRSVSRMKGNESI